VLLISQSSSQNDICFIVARPHSQATLEALATSSHKTSRIRWSTTSRWTRTSAIVAVVGENMRGTPGVAGRTFHCLEMKA